MAERTITKQKNRRRRENWINNHINIFIFMYMFSVSASSYQYPAAGSSTTNRMYVLRCSIWCRYMQRARERLCTARCAHTRTPHTSYSTPFFGIHLHEGFNGYMVCVPSTRIHSRKFKFRYSHSHFVGCATETLAFCWTWKVMYHFPYIAVTHIAQTIYNFEWTHTQSRQNTHFSYIEEHIFEFERLNVGC